MAVKLADTLAPMGDFPVAEAGNVSIDINGTTKDLQTAYEDGDLGAGGSSIQVDQMPLASAANLGKVLQYIGASGTYQQNYFYACVSDGEATPTYSWIQVNVQPSNAQASQISYDNTTSGLTADDAQEAIDEIATGLGTASAKDFTDTVRPNSHDLVESGSVYSAINNALESIYTPRGDLSCAELTSALLIADNVGSVYQMSDSGTTSALFINGAGITISAGDNIGIIKAGADTYMFNYMGNAFDLTDYQKKDLSSPIAGAPTVEAAIAQNTSDITAINGKIPSTASSTEKLAYVEYTPSTSLYSTWAELLELLHQKGAGYWTGTIYIGKWYTYTARIVLGSSGYWYGSFLAKSAENEDLVGASKTYGGTNTWVVSHYMPDTLTIHSVTKVSSNISTTDLYTDCCSKNGICDVGISFTVTSRLGDGEKMFSGLPKAGWLTRFAVVGYSSDATPNVYANVGVNSDGEIEARGIVPPGNYYLHTCYVIRT